MVSVEFIYFFLPVFMGLYAVIPAKYRYTALFSGTVILGLWFAPRGLILLGISALLAFAGGILISHFAENERKNQAKIILGICVFINVIVFLLFSGTKYFPDFLTKKQGLFSVMGAAVFTLHSISYCIDVYRKKYKVEKNPLKIAAFVGFFPCLTVGPVLNYGDISKTMDNPVITSEKLVNGIKLFLTGLIQKLVFSVPLYQVWEKIRYSDLNELNTPAAWLGIIIFALSFYYEFAGFFNIAAGLCNMLGFEVNSNINRPYISKSVVELSKRFNSSLYVWRKNYIQKPLREKTGGIFASATGLFIGGLWYGICSQTILFSAWAVVVFLLDYYAFRYLRKKRKRIRGVIVNLLILVGLPLLAVHGTTNSVKYIGIMFGLFSGTGEYPFLYMLSSCGILLVAGILFISGIGRKIKNKLNCISEDFVSVVMPVFEIIMLIIVSAFLSGTPDRYLAFLY